MLLRIFLMFVFQIRRQILLGDEFFEKSSSSSVLNQFVCSIQEDENWVFCGHRKRILTFSNTTTNPNKSNNNNKRRRKRKRCNIFFQHENNVHKSRNDFSPSHYTCRSSLGIYSLQISKFGSDCLVFSERS